MPCFECQSPELTIHKSAGTTVLLKDNPGSNVDDPAEVYVWEPVDDCQRADPVDIHFSHSASLQRDQSFVFEQRCREHGNRVEGLYGARVKVGDLSPIGPAPPGSGCQ